MPAAFAFLHHIAAFALVSALAIEFTLTRGELTVKNARTILIADAVFGASAGTILVVGLLRVFFFEKGAAYYLHSAPFIAKVSLFAVIGLLPINPDAPIPFVAPSLRQGATPDVEPATMRTIRALIHAELACVVLVMLCAALMARGIGYFGA